MPWYTGDNNVTPKAPTVETNIEGGNLSVFKGFYDYLGGNDPSNNWIWLTQIESEVRPVLELDIVGNGLWTNSSDKPSVTNSDYIVISSNFNGVYAQSTQVNRSTYIADLNTNGKDWTSDVTIDFNNSGSYTPSGLASAQTGADVVINLA